MTFEIDDALKHFSLRDAMEQSGTNEIDNNDWHSSKQLCPMFLVLMGIETETISEL